MSDAQSASALKAQLPPAFDPSSVGRRRKAIGGVRSRILSGRHECNQLLPGCAIPDPVWSQARGARSTRSRRHWSARPVHRFGMRELGAPNDNRDRQHHPEHDRADPCDARWARSKHKGVQRVGLTLESHRKKRLNRVGLAARPPWFSLGLLPGRVGLKARNYLSESITYRHTL
jgi:hypothetical protein